MHEASAIVVSLEAWADNDAWEQGISRLVFFWVRLCQRDIFNIRQRWSLESPVRRERREVCETNSTAHWVGGGETILLLATVCGRGLRCRFLRGGKAGLVCE